MKTTIKLKPILFLTIYLLIFQLLFPFCTSKNNKNSKSIKNAVSSFISDTIILPKSNKILYNDSLFDNKNQSKSKIDLKITTSISGECYSCINELQKWKELFQYTNSINGVNILFYLYTSDIKLFMDNYYEEKIHQFPLIIDQKNRYIINNNLPINKKMYQTFLLDSNNKVILVGNPIYSEKLMELYKKEINKRLD